MENVRNSKDLNFIKSDDTQEMYEKKSKTAITGFKSYHNFDCLAFKNQTLTYRQPINLAFRVLGYFELFMYENPYNVSQPNL